MFFLVNNIVVKYFFDKNKELDLLKTLKLVYLYFGLISSLESKYLFSERIEAWRPGPVVPNLYYKLKDTVDKESYNTTEDSYKIKNNNLDLDISTKKMVDITHIPNGPWDNAYNGLPNLEIKKNHRLLRQNIK